MTDKILIAPSLLSADISRLGEEISAVLGAGADWIHFDVMDGCFVPNMSIGLTALESLSGRVKAFYDVHLMIDKPWRYVQRFVKAGASVVSVHAECGNEREIADTIRIIRDSGAKAGLVLKPGTSAEAAVPHLPMLDLVMVMTVEPGFGGQRFISDMLPKIAAMRGHIDAANPSCLLEVDGGVSADNARLCVDAGANVLVAGNAVFLTSDYSEAIRKLRCQ